MSCSHPRSDDHIRSLILFEVWVLLLDFPLVLPATPGASSYTVGWLASGCRGDVTSYRDMVM
jgi:hypothetical protein